MRIPSLIRPTLLYQKCYNSKQSFFERSRKQGENQMVNQATILLATDEAVAGNKALQQYIEHTTDDYCTLWLEGALLVVVKNIKEQKYTTDERSMLASAIARKLRSDRL